MLWVTDLYNPHLTLHQVKTGTFPAAAASATQGMTRNSQENARAAVLPTKALLGMAHPPPAALAGLVKTHELPWTKDPP